MQHIGPKSRANTAPMHEAGPDPHELTLAEESRVAELPDDAQEVARSLSVILNKAAQGDKPALRVLRNIGPAIARAEANEAFARWDVIKALSEARRTEGNLPWKMIRRTLRDIAPAFGALEKSDLEPVKKPRGVYAFADELSRKCGAFGDKPGQEQNKFVDARTEIVRKRMGRSSG
jgi:hypothetical protein